MDITLLSLTNGVPSTDFGNKERNLLVQIFWIAMEICEIGTLDCKLAKQSLCDRDVQRSQLF